MSLCNSPDIFQEKMNELFAAFDYVRAYIDDVLIISNGSFQDHSTKVGTVLDKLLKAGFKVNAEKSFFAQDSLEYLGFKITRNGIMPLPEKVQAIQNMDCKETTKEFHWHNKLIQGYVDP